MAAERESRYNLLQTRLRLGFSTLWSDVVCLRMLGSELHTLGPVFLLVIDCSPKDMVLNGGIIREWSLLRL